MMSVMLSEGVMVSSPPVEPTPPPAGFSLYPALLSVTCRQVASHLPDKAPCNCTEFNLERRSCLLYSIPTHMDA